MDYFETYATETQKADFEQYIRKNTTFNLLDTEVDRKSTLDAASKLREFAGVVPESICLTDYDVTYNVESCELIKVNGVNHYKLEISAFPDESIIEKSSYSVTPLYLVVDFMTKDKYFGDCRQVILNSTVHGLVGPATKKYHMNYIEIVPNIFKNILTLHTDEELKALYIDKIVDNARELLYRDRFYE